MDLSFYEGHPVLVHASSDDRDGIMELPHGWDEQNFKWPAESDQTIRVDVGARSPEEVAKLGIKVGDSITIPKEYRPLLGTRANGRSFDDRVGDTALISAVWALGGPLKDRDVTFVWSTGEEIGLVGAGKLATRLAAEGRAPDYVFAVDTLVSSDSPLESKRFADAEIGKGFAIRAVDSSNIAPHDLVEKVEKLARANQDPRATRRHRRRQRRRDVRSLRRGRYRARLAAALFAFARRSDRHARRGRARAHHCRDREELVTHEARDGLL